MPVRLDIGTLANQPIGVHGTVDLYSDVVIGTVSIAGTLTTSSVITSGTLGELTHLSTGGTIEAVKTVQSGSIGILGQPIEIHGTVDLHSDVTIGTVNIAGTITTSSIITSGTLGELTHLSTSGTIEAVKTVQSGSIGVIAGTLGEIAHVSTMGTVNEITHLSNMGTLDSITSIKSGTININEFAPSSGGAKTPSGQVNVLSTSTTILSALTTRSYAGIQNVGGTSIYLSFGGAAGTERGVRVANSGGFYEINQTNLWRGTVEGITAGESGTTSVIITEWER
ncbi:MAG: hypothetical protein Q8O68_00465 [Candidatus Daviesbacteria bacterium]|nr:hypothetical protein [Candidatus Daviesbacteria bacterium]